MKSSRGPLLSRDTVVRTLAGLTIVARELLADAVEGLRWRVSVNSGIEKLLAEVADHRNRGATAAAKEWLDEMLTRRKRLDLLQTFATILFSVIGVVVVYDAYLYPHNYREGERSVDPTLPSIPIPWFDVLLVQLFVITLTYGFFRWLGPNSGRYENLAYSLIQVIGMSWTKSAPLSIERDELSRKILLSAAIFKKIHSGKSSPRKLRQLYESLAAEGANAYALHIVDAGLGSEEELLRLRHNTALVIHWLASSDWRQVKHLKATALSERMLLEGHVSKHSDGDLTIWPALREKLTASLGLITAIAALVSILIEKY